MKKLIFLIIAVLIAELTAETLASTEVKVVDGDSLEIGTRRIRLIGIDAPELFQECFDENGKSYFCGEDAKDYLKKMIDEGISQGFKVKCDVKDVDRYKRDLSVCHIENLNLNIEMLKAGYAMAYRNEAYQKIEKREKKAKKGIWRGKFMRPELYRALKREREKQNPPEQK